MRIVSLPKNWLPLFQRFCAIYTRMGQPQQINDNKGMFETGTLKTQKRKTRDEKTRHQNAGVENARLEHAAPYCNHRKRRTGKLIMRMLFEWRKTLINVTDEKELGCFAKTEKSSHIIATGAAIPRTIAMPTVTLLHTHWKNTKEKEGHLKEMHNANITLFETKKKKCSSYSYCSVVVFWASVCARWEWWRW